MIIYQNKEAKNTYENDTQREGEISQKDADERGEA